MSATLLPLESTDVASLIDTTMSASDLRTKRQTRLFERYRVGREAHLRDEIVVEYTPLVNHLVHKFTNRAQPFDDLRQVAFIGLLHAIERFDPAVGASFRTFACATIVGHMKRDLRDHSWVLKVSRRLLELRPRVHRALDSLTSEHGRPPKAAEIAAMTGLAIDDVLEILDMEQCTSPKSLDAPAYGDSTQTVTVAQGLTVRALGMDEVEHRMTLRVAFEHVTPAEQRVLFLRFYLDLTQVEIAVRVHSSQMQVSRCLRRALGRMKAFMEAPPQLR